MKKFRFAICFLLILVTSLSLVFPAFAASTRNITTGGNGKTVTVLTIKTNKKTTLNFNQKKGVFAYPYAGTGEKYLSTYGDFFIHVVDKSGRESRKTYYCSFASSKTITLSANKTYQITISPRAKSVTFDSLVRSGKLWNRFPNSKAYHCRWTKVPDWTVTAKNVISLKINSVTTATQQ